MWVLDAVDADSAPVVDTEVLALDVVAFGLGSIPVTTLSTCFLLKVPRIQMFHMGNFEGPSSVGQFNHVSLPAICRVMGFDGEWVAQVVQGGHFGFDLQKRPEPITFHSYDNKLSCCES